MVFPEGRRAFLAPAAQAEANVLAKKVLLFAFLGEAATFFGDASRARGRSRRALRRRRRLPFEPLLDGFALTA